MFKLGEAWSGVRNAVSGVTHNADGNPRMSRRGALGTIIGGGSALLGGAWLLSGDSDSKNNMPDDWKGDTNKEHVWRNVYTEEDRQSVLNNPNGEGGEDLDHQTVRWEPFQYAEGIGHPGITTALNIWLAQRENRHHEGYVKDQKKMTEETGDVLVPDPNDRNRQAIGDLKKRIEGLEDDIATGEARDQKRSGVVEIPAANILLALLNIRDIYQYASGKWQGKANFADSHSGGASGGAVSLGIILGAMYLRYKQDGNWKIVVEKDTIKAVLKKLKEAKDSLTAAQNVKKDPPVAAAATPAGNDATTVAAAVAAAVAATQQTGQNPAAAPTPPPTPPPTSTSEPPAAPADGAPGGDSGLSLEEGPLILDDPEDDGL
jgi:hypothetical protein